MKRAVHGVLLLDKPVGLSSNTAMQKARRLLRAEKAGHTGTLDPLASGLLPIAFGAATKFSQAGLDADKRYRATLQLGVTTSTGDAEGEVLQQREVGVSNADLLAACAAFTGTIDQVPPMFSALKHQGRALYDYARAGIDVDRAPRRSTIPAIALVAGEGARWTIDVCCSKGTYIRSRAQDIGDALGCGAHLTALRRTGSGTLEVRDAITLEALAALGEAARDALLRPADALVADWPIVRLAADDAARFLTGLRRRIALADAPEVRVYGPEPRAFLGAGHIAGGELISTRLLSPVEVQGMLHASTADAGGAERTP